MEHPTFCPASTDPMLSDLIVKFKEVFDQTFKFITSTILFDNFIFNRCGLLGLQSVAISTLIVYLIWKLFYQPFDLFRDFTELGFEEADKQKNSVSRKNMINGLRRRRKIGNLPPSYPNGWFGLLESDELKIGGVREVDVLGLNLVAWRGKSGTAYVADAHCPHLGANLGVGGRVHDECIQCPFHSWTFDGEKQGKLACIPYAEKVPDFVNLKMWTILETNGFILLWFHAENQSPTWFPDSLPEVDEHRWAYRGRSEFRITCHVQEIPENGPDVSHLNVLHGDAVFCGDNPDKAFFSWGFIKHAWEAKWCPNPDPERSHEALLKVTHYLNLFGVIPFFYVYVDVHQVGPGMVCMRFKTILGEGVLVQTVTPIEPLMQRVVHRFYSSATLIHPIAKFILDSEAKQIARDVRIWNRKCYLDKPVLSKEDNQIRTFRRWFQQFYSENSPRHYFPSNDRNANKLSF